MIATFPPSVAQAVELLERALGYTRGRLVSVRRADLAAPTPCADWDLRDLLTHMDDALDAFLEAAAGVVALRPRPPGPVADTVERVQAKACALLGLWTTAVRDGRQSVVVGGRPVPGALLVGTAALEVTVHGWDVGRSTGEGGRIPVDLARALLPVAAVVVTPADRGVRFASPRPVAPADPADHVLLAHLGRSVRPIGQFGQILDIPDTGTGAAS